MLLLRARQQRHERVRSACLVGVRVETTPPGAISRSDGFPIGTSPLEANLIAGQHGFEAELSGYGGPAVGRTLLPGQPRAVITLDMKPLPTMIALKNLTPESTVLISGIAAKTEKVEVQPDGT